MEDDSENDLTDRTAPLETDRPLAILLPFAKSTFQLYLAVTLCVAQISDLLNIVTNGDVLSFIGGQLQMFILSMYIELKYDCPTYTNKKIKIFFWKIYLNVRKFFVFGVI